MDSSQTQALVDEAAGLVASCGDANALANAKARFLGRDGLLTQRMKSLGKLSGAERAAAGRELNAAKQRIEALLAEREAAIEAALLDARLSAEAIDVTLPGRSAGHGGLHPLTLTIARVEEIFRSIGFDVADGPEIEEDFFNFTALNTPADHPARSMHDTFYVDPVAGAQPGLLLRTHTSPMQIRYARAHQPPIRVIAPGKAYRVDSDATHSPMFHQVEGLWVDDDISLADLKNVYADFLAQFFERDDIDLRFRPSYFPFTEPSAEIDMRFADGPLAGRWLEVSGAGQVHPDVVRNIGLDPERYIGFAFGSGIERLTMLRYGVGDLRVFYENDLRFLQQFSR
ncbi:MAG: phenylalanine--tRNA ligase subunit alpha [Burkholderiaceae bacterium]|jgi:phenylalanyl-tRNA synthetase alpha chain|nr:phenylalanine--tRNA ligase subunit alpha [Burkholderiaceae bacterium]MEB2319856.1 phenylalanine--tRNA ligase subunit alpha [Pseudomonadota bacterium]